MSATNEKSTRLLEAAIAVLGGAESQKLNIVALNKALFYLDLYALRDSGKTITGAAYYALDQGPVIADYQRRLVRALERAGYGRQLQEGMAKPVQLVRRLERFEYLSTEDQKMASDIGAIAANRTSSMLSAMSHENPGWQLAHRQEGPKQRIDMSIAMQQVAEDDPWLDAPPDEELLKAFAEAEQPGEPWV